MAGCSPKLKGSDVSRALITGITGQDGLYLGELLASKGYEVFGLIRDPGNPKVATVHQLIPSAQLVEGDLTDLPSLIEAVKVVQPQEVYNLAAMSSVGLSWKQAERTAEVTGMGVLRLLEAIRFTRDAIDSVRLFQASSSQMFGLVRESPQRESTPLRPCSPYGVAKTFAHHTAVTYRESYGAFASCGILMNHESPRHSEEFVVRKVTRAVARISLGLQLSLTLGKLDSRRDWGFAGDYVEAMWRMLQLDTPDDFIIATGKTHSVRELLAVAFGHVGIDDWERYVVHDRTFSRPSEPQHIVGDSSKARNVLGWRPRVGFRELVAMMVDADLAIEQRVTTRSDR